MPVAFIFQTPKKPGSVNVKLTTSYLDHKVYTYDVLKGKLGAMVAIATCKLHTKGNLANLLRYNNAIDLFVELMQGMDIELAGDAAPNKESWWNRLTSATMKHLLEHAWSLPIGISMPVAAMTK